MTINYQEDLMAAVPQQEPAKPEPRKRPPATWLVYEVTENGLEHVGEYGARTAEAACWLAAENEARDDAMSDQGVELVGIKDKDFEPRTYRLRSTVERVRA